ncbi:MAG: restriction endonuclease [Chloroflexota bacterium]|nr:restriction endonuclease [Chloroflexota bacterium]
MMNDIMANVGSQQSQVNWKNPDDWIPERLEGQSRELAKRLWQESGQLVNPRHSAETRSFVNIHGLAQFQDNGIQLTERGHRFLSQSSDLVRSIDEYEGLLFVLKEIVENGPVRRLDLSDSFETYCRTHTSWNAASSIDLALSARVRHLKERSLIERVGHTYQSTAAGLKYLNAQSSTDSKGTAVNRIRDLANQTHDSARKQLREFIKSMDPYQFEYLVKRLLEAMGYEDVEVTKASNDKGVDVVADIELGISRVREVIQVKRQTSNVGRNVLDSLRGSLHRFDAVRATVITTGGFAKGAKDAAFEKGAAPITLIDGSTLINLLSDNDIGIRRSEVKIMEFHKESLQQPHPEPAGD